MTQFDFHFKADYSDSCAGEMDYVAGVNSWGSINLPHYTGSNMKAGAVSVLVTDTYLAHHSRQTSPDRSSVERMNRTAKVELKLVLRTQSLWSF